MITKVRIIIVRIGHNENNGNHHDNSSNTKKYWLWEHGETKAPVAHTLNIASIPKEVQNPGAMNCTLLKKDWNIG